MRLHCIADVYTITHAIRTRNSLLLLLDSGLLIFWQEQGKRKEIRKSCFAFDAQIANRPEKYFWME